MRVAIFSDWAVPTPRALDRYASCGVRDVILGVSNSNRAFILNYNQKAWADACRESIRLGMLPHIMVWGVPRPDVLEEGVTQGLRIWSASGADDRLVFWVNAEKTWHGGTLSNVGKCADVLVERSNEVMPAVVGLDTLNKKVEVLAKACTIVCPEAYSFWNPEPGHWSQCGHTFPGVMQRSAYASWSKVLQERTLVMGMACYYEARPASGHFPGCSAAQSRRWAISEVCAIRKELGRDIGVAYWSGKFIDGDSPQESERRDFLLDVSRM